MQFNKHFITIKEAIVETTIIIVEGIASYFKI
jgi:hypothetical protein